MSFSQLGLSEALTRAVAEQGYSTPTPIQSKAIPAVLAGGDLLAGAQTGTGKTAGFVLPILHRLTSWPPRAAAPRETVTPSHPSPSHASRAPASHAAMARRGAPTRPLRALILTPTRELAMQVEASVRTYGKYLPLTSTIVIGGVGLNPQKAVLKRGVDVLVATPGRLLDHHAQRNVDLSTVEVVVLDEADRMLDMGFIHDVRRVLGLLPKRRQNLLFSATFPDAVRALADQLLDRPAVVEVAPRNATADMIEQVVHPVDHDRKRALLATLVADNDWRQVLVFTRTKHGANKLAEQLNRDGIESLAIHGNKSQGARTQALARFKHGDVRVLVATDIAARGIDIDQLPHVVNYDLPHVPEDYVHRIGRTGRAGASGEAVSLVSVDDQPLLRGIEKLLRKTIRRETIAGFEPNPNARREPLAARPGRPELGRRTSAPGNHPRSAGSSRRGTSSRRRPAA